MKEVDFYQPGMVTRGNRRIRRQPGSSDGAVVVGVLRELELIDRMRDSSGSTWVNRQHPVGRVRSETRALVDRRTRSHGSKICRARRAIDRDVPIFVDNYRPPVDESCSQEIRFDFDVQRSTFNVACHLG